MKEEFADEPHAYVKLWKHYGAYEEAEIILDLAKKRGEKWLSQCGGYISPEWMLPKIFETLRKAPKGSVTLEGKQLSVVFLHSRAASLPATSSAMPPVKSHSRYASQYNCSFSSLLG